MAYVGKSVSARIVRVSGTNLFAVAARYLGDATLWYKIASLNNMTDPWITTTVTLLLPSSGGVSNGGILT